MEESHIRKPRKEARSHHQVCIPPNHWSAAAPNDLDFWTKDQLSILTVKVSPISSPFHQTTIEEASIKEILTLKVLMQELETRHQILENVVYLSFITEFIKVDSYLKVYNFFVLQPGLSCLLEKPLTTLPSVDCLCLGFLHLTFSVSSISHIWLERCRLLPHSMALTEQRGKCALTSLRSY